MRSPKPDTMSQDCLTPIAFVENWQSSLNKLNIQTGKDAENETIAIWKLEGRKLKYKRIEFDNCYFTVRVLQYNINYVQLKVGLMHATSKLNGPETTHYRQIILTPEQYSNIATIFSKLIIVAANLTRQGKVEPNICDDWLRLIKLTMEVQ